MFTRDLILDEVQKLALVLARLLGLKAAGKQAEFVQLAESTALIEYNIPRDELLDMPLPAFETWLSNEAFSADKLDALAQLLYLHAGPFDNSTATFLLLQKILFIYDLLEQKHHRQSLENINRRRVIEQFMVDGLR